MKIIDINKAEKLINVQGMYRTANFFKVSEKTLRKRLIENNIKTVHFFKIPKFNNRFFQNIDTEQKAYWLGFMFADGFVSRGKRNNFITSIELEEKDKSHIEKFKNTINHKNKLYYSSRTYTKTWKILISSKEMFDDLISHGCVERKSLILDWPMHVPNDLIRHFIRGYFDGDGCIMITKYGWAINFTSSSLFLNKLKTFFEKMGCGIRKINLWKTNNKSGQLVYSKKSDLNLILDFMYKDATIYLDRKFNLYNKRRKEL